MKMKKVFAVVLALAMVCRCYRGGDGRTRMKQLKLGFGDLAACCVTGLVMTGVIVLNIYLK